MRDLGRLGEPRPLVLPSRGWPAYVGAFAGVAFGIGARAALTPALGPTAIPFIFLFPVITAVAWYGGAKPALLATGLAAAAADWFFLEPAHSLLLATLQDQVALLAFVASCGFIIAAIEGMHRARANLGKARDVLAITLASIGDGVVVTDAEGRVTFLNGEAERLTGWTNAEAVGQPLTEVFRIANENTQQPTESPVVKVLRTGGIVGLANHTVLIPRTGEPVPIDDSSAPVRQGGGPILGVVLVFRDVSAKRAADLVRTQLAAIVEHSGDAILTTDLDGIVRTWNAGAERLLGYGRDEVIGTSITRLIPPDRPNEQAEVLARIVEGQSRERRETIRLTKDGQPLHVLASVSPLKDADGRVIGASKIIHDITDIVAARQALDAEKVLLATTLASIGDAVIVTDSGGRVGFMNAEAERLTGWSDAASQGLDLPEVFRIINEQSRTSVENPVDKVFRLGTVVGLANHTLLVSRDGTERPIDDSAAPIRLADGSQSGVVLVFRDVEDRRRTENELRASEERFRLMANAAPVLIWVSGTDKLCTWFNQRWLDFVGRSMEQELGNGWADNVHPDDFARCLHTYVAAFDAREPFSMTYRLRRADGEFRWILDIGSPQNRPGGDFAGYIGSCVDVTDHKRAEEMLREADRRKDEFLAILSHELRNPLAPIRMAVSMLHKLGPSQPQLQQLRDIIDRQAVHLTRLLDDLLDVSRIGSGKISLRTDRVRLTGVLAAAMEAVRPLIEGQGQELVVEITDELIEVDGDLGRLSQVFSNVINNASKFSDKGGRITVRAERDGSEAVVRVRDTGVGIAADQLAHVFEMFAQVDQSLDRGKGGLGVGLSLARTLVELHGGSIEARSGGLGMGSEFIVRLPIALSIATPSAPPASDLPDEPDQGRYCILVADDNADSTLVLATALRLAGHDVITADDGVSAIEAAATFRPDVAILDVGMPRMSGYEVARRLRDERNGDIVLVAVTGWGQENDKRRAYEAGFDHHLAKPVDLQTILSLLKPPSATAPDRVDHDSA